MAGKGTPRPLLLSLLALTVVSGLVRSVTSAWAGCSPPT
jgi:hypothetical protein